MLFIARCLPVIRGRTCVTSPACQGGSDAPVLRGLPKSKSGTAPDHKQPPCATPPEWHRAHAGQSLFCTLIPEARQAARHRTLLVLCLKKGHERPPFDPRHMSRLAFGLICPSATRPWITRRLQELFAAVSINQIHAIGNTKVTALWHQKPIKFFDLCFDASGQNDAPRTLPFDRHGPWPWR